MTLEQKARHIKCEALVSKIKGGWYCANCNSYVNGRDVVVGFEDARQEINKVCREYQDLIHELRKDEIKERGLQKQKIQELVVATTLEHTHPSPEFWKGWNKAIERVLAVLGVDGKEKEAQSKEKEAKP
jgi:hypothetical protein